MINNIYFHPNIPQNHSYMLYIKVPPSLLALLSSLLYTQHLEHSTCHLLMHHPQHNQRQHLQGPAYFFHVIIFLINE